MGRVTTTITVTNHIDEILAERGFIPSEQIRSMTLELEKQKLQILPATGKQNYIQV